MSVSIAGRPSWGRIPYDLDSRSPWLRVPFSLEEYQSRWRRIGEKLAADDLDALIVLGAPGDGGHVRYVTNFESAVGQTAAIITRSGQCAIATNSLMRAEPMQSSIWTSYVEDVRPTSPKRYMPDAKPLEQIIVEILTDYVGTSPRLAIVGQITTAAATRLGELSSGGMRDYTAEFTELAAIKSPAEIALLRRAISLADNVLEAVRGACVPGVTESQLAGIAFQAMMEGGAEGPCFPLALVGGPRSGLKHVLPSDYRLQHGDLFFIDLGLVLDGYVTDNARSGLVGKGSDESKRFLEAASRMTDAAIAVAGPGVPQSKLDDAAFEVAREFGYADDYYFRAHGIGTTLFQAPRFNPGDRTALRVNEVFSLEPMLVRHGFGTACVERTLLVTENGCETLDRSRGIWLDVD